MARVTWHAHPDVWLVMIALIGGYIFAVTRLGPRYAPLGTEPATTRQKVLFFTGAAIMWIGADSPIHDISEDYLFSAHMVQHLLFTLVAPGLILLGIPVWLFRWLLQPPGLFRVAKTLTRPLIAFAIFNALVALTHWPWVVNTSVTNELFHFGVHLVIVTSAFIMWWPVVAPLPELRTLSDPGKMLYLFGQSILPTVPASFLTFASHPIYSSYAGFPRLWGISAEHDQMFAGLIMKLGGGLLLWGIIAAVFFRWYSREESGRQDTIGWDDFEHSLDAWNLRRT
jgi:putative membrane protein